MTISTFERNATIAEMAVEIDRRGAVIERLEAERDTLTAALAASTAREVTAEQEAKGAWLTAEREMAGRKAAESRATDDFEHYVRNAIDNAPEPLRRLGEYLTDVLDEDQWAHADPILLGVAVEIAASTAREKAKDVEIAGLRSVMEDLLSWFDDEPEPRQWVLPAGEYGADDAIKAARAVLSGRKPDKEGT